MNVSEILRKEINKREAERARLQNEIEGLDTALKVIDNGSVEVEQVGNSGVIPKQVTFETLMPIEDRFVVPKPTRKYKKSGGAPNRSWTNKELNELKRLIDEGKNLNFIANVLGRSKDAILIKLYTTFRGQYKRAGNRIYKTGKRVLTYGRKEWSKQEDQMLEGMHANGFAWKQIAERLRRTPSSVYKRHRRMNGGV